MVKMAGGLNGNLSWAVEPLLGLGNLRQVFLVFISLGRFYFGDGFIKNYKDGYVIWNIL